MIICCCCLFFCCCRRLIFSDSVHAEGHLLPFMFLYVLGRLCRAKRTNQTTNPKSNGMIIINRANWVNSFAFFSIVCSYFNDRFHTTIESLYSNGTFISMIDDPNSHLYSSCTCIQLGTVVCSCLGFVLLFFLFVCLVLSRMFVFPVFYLLSHWNLVWIDSIQIHTSTMIAFWPLRFRQLIYQCLPLVPESDHCLVKYYHFGLRITMENK